MRHDTQKSFWTRRDKRLLKSENLTVDQQYFQRKILIRKEKIMRESLTWPEIRRGCGKSCHTCVMVRALWEEPYLYNGALWL